MTVPCYHQYIWIDAKHQKTGKHNKNENILLSWLLIRHAGKKALRSRPFLH
jgi:hypothetical protein